MATSARYFVPFRRRKEGRTDYYQRLRLIISRRPRFVVRKTTGQIIVQLIVAEMTGDRTLVSATSGELSKFGYTGYTRNTPAAYLTGMLCAIRAQKAGYEGGILDIGLNRATKGSRVFAALKGAIEAGFDIPYGETILPDDDRVKGVHIAAYAPERASGIVANVEEVADAIMKELE